MRMKTAYLVIFGLCTLLSITSCTQRWTCHCDLTYSNAPGLPANNSKEYDITDTKSNAKTTCQNESGTYTNNYIITNEKCYLY